MTQPLIADLINVKRASGPDPEFERLLTERWYCPNCKEGRTILDTAIGPRAPLLACSTCDKVGIGPARGDSLLKWRRFLSLLAPFNRSGSA